MSFSVYSPLDLVILNLGLCFIIIINIIIVRIMVNIKIINSLLAATNTSGFFLDSTLILKEFSEYYITHQTNTHWLAEIKVLFCYVIPACPANSPI